MLHFNQIHLANNTPFGQHGNLAHYIDPMNPNNQHDNILDGTHLFDADTSPELDQWINELQWKTEQ